MTTPAQTPSRWRRARRAAVVLVVLFVVLPRAPETDWFARQVAVFAGNRGATLNWSALRCTWRSGFCEWNDLIVESAGVHATIGVLRVRWEWRPLLDGHVVLPEVAARGVRVKPSAVTPVDETPSPLSHTLAPLRELPSIELRRLTVEELAIDWPVATRRVVAEQLRLDGNATLGDGAATAVKLTLNGAKVKVLEQTAPLLDAVLGLTVRATVDDHLVMIAADVQVDTSEPAWPILQRDALKLDARLGFVPASARVEFEVKTLAALGGAVTGTLSATLPDEGAPVVSQAEVNATLDPLAPLIRQFEPSVLLDGAALRIATVPEEPGTLDTTLKARKLGAFTAALDDFEFHARVKPEGEVVAVTAQAKAAAVNAAPVRVSQPAITFDAPGFNFVKLQGDMSADLEAKTVEVDGAAHTSVGRSTLKATAALGAQRRLTLKGTPGPVRVTAGSTTIDVQPAPLDVVALVDLDHRVTSATGDLPLRRVVVKQADDEVVSINEMKHTVTMKGDPRDAADLNLSLSLENTLLQQGEQQLAIPGVGLKSTARLVRGRLTHANGTLSHRGLHGAGLDTEGGVLTISFDEPEGGAMSGRVEGTLPPLTMNVSAERRGPGLHATWKLGATSLAALAPLFPSQGNFTVDPSTQGFRFDGTADVPDLKRPTQLSLDAELKIPRPAARFDERRVSAESLSLRIKHRHEDRLDRGRARLRIKEPAVENAVLPKTVKSELTLALDRPKGKGALKLVVDTGREQTLGLDLALRREADGRLHHELQADVANLGSWAPLVGELSATPPGLALEPLAARLVSEGDTMGLIDANFLPVAGWQATSDTTLRAGLEVTNVVHHLDGEDTKVPRISVAVDAGVLHGAVSVRADVNVPSLELDVGRQHVALSGVHQVLTLHSDTAPDAGLLHLALDGTIDDLEQNLWPAWKPSPAQLSMKGSVERLATFTIDDLKLNFPEAGTQLQLSSKLRSEASATSAEPGESLDVAGQRFRLQGRLTQNLAQLDGAPLSFQCQGNLRANLRVQSADLSMFRVRGRVEFSDAGVSLPSQQIEVEGATGVIPFEEAFTIDAVNGVQLVIAADQPAFVRARSRGAQPVQSAGGTLSMRRLTWKGVTLAPVVASLALEPNRFSLYKFKAERGPARIAGQLFLEFRPGEELITFRGTLTGLERKGADTPLDANAAFTFIPRRLELDGRVQVVRTSREHLLDLLDVIDPHHEVGSLNTVRSAMAFGYPREAQFDFSDGLLSMDIAFGGLAALFELGTVRGVSLGPFMNRYLAPALRSSP